ncbi:MAG: tRNA preQ1(34) S-adenosylmethionine ribosyltransferase-isomerase QueA [candidate division Zixibacteria bacterium CG_4_9_14_3_um_filter_46_8]|nr:MAG: tRNA preQ1(34) S-adenosylmethionine ribosyltransferase-isomerase QueA [candidate division Zixibacteria bacterium CG_4_9_14_3_um_filter_46_8]
MELADYDYHLPRELIAQYPLDQRDQSRLLVLSKETGDIQHRRFDQIIEFLRPGDCLVINNSKVFPARLYGKRKPSGGQVEIFLLRKIDDLIWEALVNPGKKLAPGTEVEFAGDFACRVLDRTAVGGRLVEFQTHVDIDYQIQRYGHIPLPPYINREDEPLDMERYQTVYASVNGAVAAPTAGFHFSLQLLTQIQSGGVAIAEITLHPSLGTFRPVTVQNPEDHKMESEFFSISEPSAQKINSAVRNGGRVIAVGTTSVRTLERAAIDSESDHKYVIAPSEGFTDIYIYPPYKFKVVKALITNFHLPKSTLLFLVSAIAGRENVMNAYEEAKKNNYRFYSYGDAMLII